MSEEISITNFNADKARQYVNEWEKDQINRVLEDILQASINGQYELVFKETLTNETLEKLKEKGFTIVNYNYKPVKTIW